MLCTMMCTRNYKDKLFLEVIGLEEGALDFYPVGTPYLSISLYVKYKGEKKHILSLRYSQTYSEILYLSVL